MKERKAYKELYNGLVPFPINSPCYDTNFVLNKEDYSKIFLGVCPMNMEDKWFVYEENNEVYMYRSWTDICIAKLLIEKLSNDNYLIFKICINGDILQYETKGKNEDIALVVSELQSIFNVKLKENPC